MSNCSDALEKQRFMETSGKVEMSDEPLYINVITNEKDRTVTIFDSGIGMTKAEVIDNLGTIAKSGSQEFVKSLGDNVKADNIIGQFGVGFYSTFIVANHVEVISKNDQSSKAVRWVSDGSGNFEVFDVEGIKFK
jgi:HSP90 family molecular chaperone